MTPNPKPKGSRLPEDWYPTPDLIDWAMNYRINTLEERDFSRLDLDNIIEDFVDYWVAKTSGATKMDWARTFKRWIRNAKLPRRYPTNSRVKYGREHNNPEGDLVL